MISGFNTDIEFENTVFHVQTEDKGLKSRLIVSLVYNKGTILASKRVNYDDLLIGKFEEKKLVERVNRQHQLICAAVSSGRLDELKEMTGKERSRTAKAPAAIPAAMVELEQALSVRPHNVVETVGLGHPAELTHTQADIPHARGADVPDLFADEPVLEAVAIIEDEMILDAGAVAVVSELSGRDRPSNTKLSLELLGDSKFKGGDRRTVNIMICRGTDRKVIGNAEIMMKVLGSSFRPVIFHARSDVNGLAKVHMQLPHFEAGRAALLVRAIADGEEVELRRAVTPG
ncbi:MAG: hypothetical protein ACKVQJ_13830 [Pyrinomonadaceae bacterium]